MRTSIIIVVLSLACAFLGAGEHLQWMRGGPWWRLGTASIAHWSLDQTIWDSLAFLALAFAAARRWPVRFYATLIASAIGIPLVIAIGARSVMTYRGLSGVDSALFALACVRVLVEDTRPRLSNVTSDRRGRLSSIRIVIVACAIAFALKITFEYLTGATLFVQHLAPGVEPLPVAHVAGAIVGVLSSLPWSKSNERWFSWRALSPRAPLSSR